MAHADLVDDKITLRTDWTEKDLASQVPGLNYEAQRDLWSGPAAWGVFVALCGIFQGSKADGSPRLTLGPELHAWYVERWSWYTASLELRERHHFNETDFSQEAEVIKSWRNS